MSEETRALAGSGTADLSCMYCGASVVLAPDGALQDTDGACGCTASLEQGGSGEHEVSEAACAQCGAPVEFHWTGGCPDDENTREDHRNV